VVRDATIEQMSQAVFTASPLGALGDYISEPTKLNAPVIIAVWNPLPGGVWWGRGSLV
jgi:hypothetical protein